MHPDRSITAEAASSDVVVVGSGPVGLKVALDLADAGMKVLLVESGSDGTNTTTQALSDALIVNEASHAPMAHAVKRAFGGTSNLWGGRAVPLDDIDFADRSFAPDTRWPISFSEVSRWYESACDFLDCGPAAFEDRAFAELELQAHGLRLNRLERWCANPRLRTVHGNRVLTHPNIRIAFGTTVLRINMACDGRTVRDLLVDVGGMRDRIRARSYVIAAGGLETTRLLLASRDANPRLFNGPNGPLGRHYMGHIFGSIADIVFDRPNIDRQFDFALDASHRYIRRRFTLDAPTQLKHGVLNMSAWPEPPPLDDPSHGSGILSMAYLALRTPVLGNLLSPEAIRLRKVGSGPLQLGAHAANILRDIFGSTRLAAKFLLARYGSNVRLPGFFVPSKIHRYAFNYHGEHLPCAESRVRLTERTDAFGQPRLAIDLHFTETDAASIVRTHELMDERLRAAGIAHLEYNVRSYERTAAVSAQASDGFHQIGLARMSASPRDGVVDTNARVHGTANLYLAGSAIFPSSGQANPTLTAVALAARLAAHLKTAQQSLPTLATAV
ncbi:MAG: FAD-dependent oxidoreductase [Alphaproteobacteria bacterium]|nr:FAD-dependent oxidoreductase [Alphaproteobacteria bacterium]